MSATSRTIGSLFSGIGGLELGLERAGVGAVEWQVEIDPFCRLVLAKHWPRAERFVDVSNVGRSELRRVDVVCGGFPCQDVSSAGKGAGLGGEKSGLWREFRRIVSEIRPSVVVVENVASGKRRWLPYVRRDLHLLGYRTRAVAVSAWDVGACHLRRRAFVVAADPDRVELREQSRWRGGKEGSDSSVARIAGAERRAADLDGDGEQMFAVDAEISESSPVRDALRVRREQQARKIDPLTEGSGRSKPRRADRWSTEPGLVPVVHGVSSRLARRQRRRRIRALGNTVVPQCAEVVGRFVMGEVLWC